MDWRLFTISLVYLAKYAASALLCLYAYWLMMADKSGWGWFLLIATIIGSGGSINYKTYNKCPKCGYDYKKEVSGSVE